MVFRSACQALLHRLIERENPSHPQQILARICAGRIEDAESAVQAAHQAFAAWSRKPAEERATLVEKLADLVPKEKQAIPALPGKGFGNDYQIA